MNYILNELRRLGARGVDQYEAKLRSFGGNRQKIFEFLSEARAARLFLNNGMEVTMRDKPDLELRFRGETIYAEVKHQNEKAVDRRDDAAMRARPFEFIRVGNVFEDERQQGYEGMCRTAIKKVAQYVDGAPNILIFVNYSDSLDLMLGTAVQEFDLAVQREGQQSPLRKLGGMMMFNASYGPRNGWSNVEFECLLHPFYSINACFVETMRQGQLA